jgi:hypothetical protein
VEREVTPRGWWAVDLLCGLLERAERAAVCGDLVEAHASTGRALIEVAGLVVRRQAALWLGWRPWLALFTIAIPLGFLLSIASRWSAETIFAHLWLYVRLGEVSYLAVPGWRRDVIAMTTTFLVSCAALAAWSWTLGFALARLSRGAWFTLAVVALTIVLGTTGFTTTVPLGDRRVDPLFALTAGSILTPILRVYLVLGPAWWGLRRGRARISLGSSRAIAITVAAAALTALASKELEGSLIFGWGLMLPQPGPDGIVGTADDLRPLWWISLVMLWPSAYVLTHSIRDTALRR